MRPLSLLAAVLMLLSPLLRFGAAGLRRAGLDVGGELPTLFDLNSENNVPTWFSVALWLLLVAAAVLAAALDAERRPGLLGLAAVAALMSLDEAAALHERLNGVGDALSFAPRFAWVLPGSLLAAGLVLGLARTVLQLPPLARRGLVLGGAVFVLGAIVVETLSGLVLDRAGDGVVYALVTTVEEGLEMAGGPHRRLGPAHADRPASAA